MNDDDVARHSPSRDQQDSMSAELAEAGRVLADISKAFGGPTDASWGAACEIIKKVRPLPYFLRNVIHAVFGKSGCTGTVRAHSFSPLSALLLRAARDETLISAYAPRSQAETIQLSQAVEAVGVDVAAALCYVYAVSRRVSQLLAERATKPLLDDAFLRTLIGWHVGRSARRPYCGCAMLLGFSARCGLAIQVVSGEAERAAKTLAGFASGEKISKLCAANYGCDPFQVAALALLGAGCSREMALGLASSGSAAGSAQFGEEERRWRICFDLIEALRTGKHAQVDEQSWAQLEIDAEAKEKLIRDVQMILRRGHQWWWLAEPLDVLSRQ